MSVQFRAVSLNWFANSRSFDIAYSTLSIDGKSAKKTSCALCLSTHCVRHKLSDVVFLASGVSFLITASKSLLHFSEYLKKLQTSLNVTIIIMFLIRG